MEAIDRKFQILAVNPVNGKEYDETNSFLICAKDTAAIPALSAYINACIELKCNDEHVISARLLLKRVLKYQRDIESKIPDTIGGEIQACIKDDDVLPPREVIPIKTAEEIVADPVALGSELPECNCQTKCDPCACKSTFTAEDVARIGNDYAERRAEPKGEDPRNNHDWYQKYDSSSVEKSDFSSDADFDPPPGYTGR